MGLIHRRFVDVQLLASDHCYHLNRTVFDSLTADLDVNLVHAHFTESDIRLAYAACWDLVGKVDSKILA